MPTPIEAALDRVDWKPTSAAPDATDGLPHTTHEGVLMLGTVHLRVYRLSNGRRVIDADDFHRLFS